MQPPSRNQRPDPLTSLRNISLVLRLPREMHLCRSSSNVPRLPSFLDMLQTPHVFLTFGKVQNSLRLPRETTSERAKVLRACGVFNMLTSKCASRHNHVHFFDISTSKSGPKLLCFDLDMCLAPQWHCTFSTSQISTAKSGRNMVCFVRFDLETRFAPQRRALFRHLNFKKWSEAAVVLTWKRSSHHNGVHFFDISTSKSGPKLLCFDLDMCFAPQWHALFRYLNFKQWSEHGVLCAF